MDFKNFFEQLKIRQSWKNTISGKFNPLLQVVQIQGTRIGRILRIYAD